MNWKKRYTEIIIGDYVELLKPGCGNDEICCKGQGFEVGGKYKVMEIQKDCSGENCNYKLLSDIGTKCWFYKKLITK